MRLPAQHRIILIYVLVAGLWIYGSDRLVAALVTDPAQLTQWQSIKGWAFVAVTSGLLFLLIRSTVRKLEGAKAHLVAGHEQTVDAWVRALDSRDEETAGHTERVTHLTEELARRYGIDEPELSLIRRGAKLHDIGKIGIPDSILRKPGTLTPEEWVVMRRHPEIAYRLLSSIKFLEPSLDIPYCHHERWDGSGYPRGLRGEQIPLAARLFAVVDVWESLTHRRVYKSAWSPESAAEYLRQNSGGHFDPRIVALFLDMLDGSLAAPQEATPAQPSAPGEEHNRALRASP